MQRDRASAGRADMATIPGEGARRERSSRGLNRGRRQCLYRCATCQFYSIRSAFSGLRRLGVPNG